MTAVQKVDEAVAAYITQMRARGREPVGVRCATLANLAGVSRKIMSGWLQLHLQAQELGQTDYDLSCEGYAAAARWTITRRPGRDLKRHQAARLDHLRWVMDDIAARTTRDVLREILPSLTNSDIDRDIEIETRAIRHAIDGLAQRLLSSLGPQTKRPVKRRSSNGKR